MTSLPKSLKSIPVATVILLSARFAFAAGGSSAIVKPAPSANRSPASFVVTVDRETVVEGVRLPPGSQLVFDEGALPAPLRGADGKPAPFYGPAAPVLDHVVPSREISVWGLPIAAGEELFLGPFVSLVLARAALLEGYPVEAGTVVEFERRRGPGEDQPAAIKVVRGFTLGEAATVRSVAFPGRTSLEFLADGALWRARLFDDEELLGFPVSSSADAEFHTNGRLASFRLSRDFEIDGHGCLDETEVTLHPSGRLASCVLATASPVQGVVTDNGTATTFDPEGRVTSLMLGVEAVVSGMALPAGARLDFHSNGRLRRVRPGRSSVGALKVRGIEIAPIFGREDVGASFRPDGSLETIVTGADFEYEGVPGLAGTVEFWVSGRIKSARLSRELRIGGRVYPPRTQVRFRRDGSPAHGE